MHPDKRAAAAVVALSIATACLLKPDATPPDPGAVPAATGPTGATVIPGGELDASFGLKGKITFDLGSPYLQYGNASALQSDGKIVVAGTSGNLFAAAKFKADGTIDASFGTAGSRVFQVNTGSSFGEEAYAVAIQSDGKILLVGRAYNSTSWVSNFAVARLTVAGALDTTFGTGGKTMTAIGSYGAIAHGAALQADGKLVVAGQSTDTSGQAQFTLARYTTAGALDTTFGVNGVATTTFTSWAWDTSANALAIQSDGKIVAAGTSNSKFAVARYSASGVLDAGFGTAGIVSFNAFGRDSTGTAVVLQPDGRMVVAGYSEDPGYTHLSVTVARLTSAGVLDTSFAKGGVASVNGGTTDYGRAVALQADGMILVAGFADNGSDYDFSLWRFGKDGVPDPAFGAGGRALYAVGTQNDRASSVLVQADGRIVLAGYSNLGDESATAFQFSMARVKP